jgi:hypothetical protein
MPKGTRVSRCVEKVKKSGRGVNPYAVCQASTKQSYATGKPIKEKKMNYLDRLSLIFERNKENKAKKNKAMGRVKRIPAREVGDREVHDYGSNPETVGRLRGVKKVPGEKPKKMQYAHTEYENSGQQLEESLLEGLYHSMSDMALVLAEAFGIVEATRAAELLAMGKLSRKSTRKAGVMAANVRGGERAVARKYKESGIDPEDAEKFAKNRAQASRRARKPEMSPTSQASGRQLARGLSGGPRGKVMIGKPRSRGGSGIPQTVTSRSIKKGKKIEQEKKK